MYKAIALDSSVLKDSRLPGEGGAMGQGLPAGNIRKEQELDLKAGNWTRF